MGRLVCLATGVICLLHALILPVWAGDKLYESWKYGTTRSELLTREGVRDCSEKLGTGGLCAPNDKLFDFEWEVGLKLLNGKLVQVVLAQEYSPDRHITTIQSLNNAMALVAIQNKAGDMLDIIRLMKKLNQAESDREIAAFEQACLEQGHIKYTYFSRKEVESAAKDSGDITEVIAKASEGLREADLVIDEDGVAISFSLPKQTRKLTAGG